MSGYSYQDSDLAVCGECFTDEGIKNFIGENATDEECSFCGATADEPIAAPIREVAEFIEEGIRREYGNPDECGMSWDSEDQRYYPGKTYNTADLVGDLVDLPNDDGKLFDAICYNFDNGLWCDVDQYRLSDHEQLRYSWDHLCRITKYERRFFFSSHYKDGYDDEILSPAPEFGAFGRQRDERDVRRHDELVGQVPSGLVEEEHGVSPRRHCHRDLGQMQVHRRDVAAGQDESRALAILGADGAEHIGRGGALIVRRGGSRTTPGPAAGDLVLLSDPGLLGQPDLHRGPVHRPVARQLGHNLRGA